MVNLLSPNLEPLLVFDKKLLNIPTINKDPTKNK